MPAWSKLDFCLFATSWAGQDCSCQHQLDGEAESVGFSENGKQIDEAAEEMAHLGVIGNGCGSSGDGVSKGSRIPLPWELLQPALRILGHCLLAPLSSQEVKDAAGVAVRRLHARASHDLVPQAILATRSLIQLDNRARSAAMAAAAAAAANSSSNANTPSKAKKPEILLVSK